MSLPAFADLLARRSDVSRHAERFSSGDSTFEQVFV
jgi:hypothetical protein